MAAAAPLPAPAAAPATDAATRAIVGNTAAVRESLAPHNSERAAATGSVAAAAATAQPVPSAAAMVDGHFGGRGLAVALAAAGEPVGGKLRRAEVLAAAKALGVELHDPVNEADVRGLAKAAWAAADEQWALAGIGPGDAPDRSDVVEAAARLGVKIEGELGPQHVAEVLAAGRADVAKTFTAAGFEFGDRVDIVDLEAFAKHFDVQFGSTMNAVDAKVAVFMAKDKVQRAREADQPTKAFAEVDGVVLRLPSHRVRYAGFHQAAYPVALPMDRAGKANTKVLPSRGRGTSRASAIDIVQAPDEDVRSPVTGRVVEVTHYALYGKYPDVRMRIRPKGSDHLVTVLHMEGAKVSTGDRVEAGLTVIADGPRKFPFFSQVDGFSGTGWGHVHVEIRRR